MSTHCGATPDLAEEFVRFASVNTHLLDEYGEEETGLAERYGVRRPTPEGDVLYLRPGLADACLGERAKELPESLRASKLLLLADKDKTRAQYTARLPPDKRSRKYYVVGAIGTESMLAKCPSMFSFDAVGLRRLKRDSPIPMEVSVGNWIKMLDNPIQRDTERHSRRARAEHLSAPSPAHRRVSAVYCARDALTYKLDGHTRAYLWQSGELAQPDSVLADLYYAETLEEVKSLYLQFDSKSASETPVETVSGAMRGVGFAPQSSLLQSGSLTAAMSHALGMRKGHGNSWVYSSLANFRSCLPIIDREHFKRSKFPSGVLAGLLIDVLVNGDRNMEFWRAYNEGMGRKLGKSRDTAEYLGDAIVEMKLSGLGGRRAIERCFVVSYTCAQRYQGGKMRARMVDIPTHRALLQSVVIPAIAEEER